MAISTVENDVPMQGHGFYNAHSALQAAAMHEALPLLDSIHVPQVGPFTVVEYGCAQGANSILPFQRILKAWHRKKKALQSSLFPFNNPFTACFGRPNTHSQKHHHQEALLTFSDRDSNDFNTLIQTVSKTSWLPDTKLPPPIFTSIAPGTFYSRLVPANTVSVGFSLATLHHLQRLPTLANGKPETEPEPEPESNIETQSRVQAHADLTTFLTHRAAEFQSGGTLVVSLVSRASTGVPNYPTLVDACRKALTDMVMEGIVPGAAAQAFYVPTHDRTMEEVLGTLQGVDAVWDVEAVFEREVVHPAYQKLHHNHDPEQEQEYDEKESRRYAETVVDWMMAVVGGYFVKALGVDSRYSEREKEGLIDEWRRRTVDVFLREYKDSKVACWFIYVKLRRL